MSLIPHLFIGINTFTIVANITEDFVQQQNNLFDLIYMINIHIYKKRFF